MTAIEKQVLSEHDARRLTERIRIVAHNYTDAKAKLIQLVQDAKDGNAHEALGYPSWTAYLADALGDEPMRLARDERQEMVKVLSAEGMSRPAIAAVTGASERTIQRDFKEARQGETGVSPSPKPKSDDELLSGDELSSEPESFAPEWRGLKVEAKEAAEYAKKVTGMDGKQYTRPEPSASEEPAKPRRNPLPDQARTAGWDVRKSAERIERILADDRFDRNKKEVATHLRGHLQYAIETLQTTLDQLN